MFGGNLEKPRHFYDCCVLFICLFTKTYRITNSYSCSIVYLLVYRLLRVGINLFQFFSKLVFKYMKITKFVFIELFSQVVFHHCAFTKGSPAISPQKYHTPAKPVISVGPKDHLVFFFLFCYFDHMCRPT